MNKNFLALAILVFISFIYLTTAIYAQEYQKQPVIEINLHYKEGTITFNSLTKKHGFLPDYRNESKEGYILRILDENSNELFNTKFNFPLEIFSHNFSNDKQISASTQTLTEVDEIVTVPQINNAKRVVVLDPNGNIVTTQELSQGSFNTYEEDLNKAKNTAQQALSFKFTPINILGLIFLGVIVISGLYFYRKHKKDSISSSRETSSLITPSGPQNDKENIK